jgi:hypothetical protein
MTIIYGNITIDGNIKWKNPGWVIMYIYIHSHIHTCITLHYITLPYTTLHYIALLYIAFIRTFIQTYIIYHIYTQYYGDTRRKDIGYGSGLTWPYNHPSTNLKSLLCWNQSPGSIRDIKHIIWMFLHFSRILIQFVGGKTHHDYSWLLN